MSLPELEWQILYGRIAWAIVVAAMIVSAWARPKRMPAGMPAARIALLLTGAVVLAMLPGEASYAYWMGLALQWPSGLLVGLCLGKLYLVGQGSRRSSFMPACLAAPIALAGAALYLDAIGLVALGIYYAGFGPVGAPLAAVLLALACAAAAILGRLRLPALALLLATTMFTLLRLPTGNLWDALLDPMLWVWSIVSLGVLGYEQWRGQQRGGRNPLQPGHAAPAEAPAVEEFRKSA